MATITIKLPDDDASRLRQMADRLGVTAEDLVRVGVDDLLAKPDEKFEQAVQHVLGKNADLYRRLA